jgi:PAS domain S-box-containing protein
MRAHGVVAIVNVPIFLPGGEAFGLLQVDARESREFGDDDIQFLRTYATILGPLIDRLRKVRELEANSERFRLVVENARDYAILLCDPQDVVTDWFPGAEAIFGWKAHEIIGQPSSVLFTKEDQETGVPELETETARKHGAATNVRWHRSKDGSRVFIEGQTVALSGRYGTVRGFMKIGQDTTERRRTQERQGILLAELQHRVRNVLAMVRSLISKGNGTSVEAFRSDLEGRITAMARTQALLTRGGDVGVDLECLISDELLTHPVGEDRVTISGLAVTLSPKAAEVLTLAVHELVTNAVKYGALGQAEGRLDVSWSRERKGDKVWLRLVWQEHGVSVVDAPPRVGFGTELITKRVPYELRGRGTVDMQPGGVRCVIAFPLLGGESILQSDSPPAYRNIPSPEARP